MSTPLKPWVRATFELILHAELHLRDGGDFDRRMAHIGFDNAIEVAISTYLSLDPIQRENRHYSRNDVDRWIKNYHTKLEFLESEARQRSWNLKIPNDEVVYYHKIRNNQYHAGGPGIPESEHLLALKTAALDTFSFLFGVENIEHILEDHIQERLETGDILPRNNPTVDKILDIENEPVYIAGQLYAVSEALLATDPDAYGAVVAALKESQNCLDRFSAKYPNCVQPGITHIGFVHYEETVFLKTVDTDGDVTLTDTSFIVDDQDSLLNFFSKNISPDENIDKLIDEFDVNSIINCFDFFTETAEKKISEAHQSGTLDELFIPES